MRTDDERRIDEGRRLVSPRVVANVAASVCVILVILAGLGLVWRLGAIFMLVGVSAFFAVVLNPLVEAVARRLHLRRSLAVLTVYVVGLLAGLLVASVFVAPLYTNARRFARETPGIVGNAQSDSGPVASAARRLHLQSWVSGNAHRVPDSLKRAGGPALKAAYRATGGLAALALLAVLTFMVLVEAPRWVAAALGIALGWTGVVVLPQLVSRLDPVAFALLAVGGIAYSVGAIVYARGRPDPLPAVFGYHELFHVLTLVGVSCQYVAIAFFVIRSG